MVTGFPGSSCKMSSQGRSAGLPSPACPCVIPALSPTGLEDAAVTQFPRRKILETKKEVILQCSQKMNHYAMYWYRQDPGFGLRLIYYSTGRDTIKKGDVPEGYDVSRDELERFPLTLKSASPNQTSVYFCASSESTAWHSCFLFAQKESSRPRSSRFLTPTRSFSK